MGRYGDLDYPTLTKSGMGLGLALFVLGLLGGKAGPVIFGALPGWEMAVFLDMMGIGVIVLLFTPFIFGILLPLTE